MRLAHDDAGAGEPVLLLHAGVADRRMWQPQWERLSERFRVVRCDLRGFGETPLPAERYSNAADVVELLDDLGIDQATIVGASFGGEVALEVAAAHPTRVRRLVLMCAAFDGVEPTPTAVEFDEREDALVEAGDLDGMVELNVSTWLGPEADEWARSFVRVMQRHAAEVQIAAESGPTEPEPVSVEVDPARIACPTVVVSGNHDMEHFRLIADHLTATIPRVRRVELDWAGHLPSLEQPSETTRLLLDVLTAEA